MAASTSSFGYRCGERIEQSIFGANVPLLATFDTNFDNGFACGRLG